MANVVEILIKQSGQGNAISATAKELGGLDNAASNSIGVLGRFGSALGGMATIAGGILAANLFSKIAEGIGSFVSTGLDAVSSAQQLEVAFGALLTQNNLYTQSTETMSVAVGNLAEMQTEAAAKSDDLAFAQRKLTADINTQNASIQEQRQRIIQMADGLDKNQQVARLQEMEVALEGMNRELTDSITEQGKLSKVTQDYTTVTKTSWEQVMSLTDAQRLAADQTKDLLSFVEKLAIVSPFEQEDVERVTKYAVGAGLGVDVTKKFTSAFLDWSAAVGITSVNLDEAAYQFLQIKKAGTITAIDLRQLSTRGLDLAKVIGVEMGMSIEEFNAKAKNTPAIFDELIDATIRYSNNTFAGTSEAMSTSIEGFKSTVSDLFTQSAKKVLRPLVDAITPTMSAMIGRAADFITGGGVEEIGEGLAKAIFGAFESFSGGGEGQLFSGLKALGLDSSTAKSITEITQSISDLFAAFNEGGAGGLAVALGVPQETVDAITDINTQIKDLFLTFQTSGVGGLALALGIPPDVLAGITAATDEVQRLMDVFTGGAEEGGAGGGFSAIFEDMKTQITEALPQLAADIMTGIPIALSAVATGISDYLGGPAIPLILEGLSEWGTAFWGWTTTAIEGVGTALSGILLAISAWVASPDAQAQLNTAGQGLGRALWNGLTLLIENADEAANVLMKISGGLLAAVAVITADLAFVGGQIAAGMMSGILETMGVDLQPATLTELKTILDNIASDGAIIAEFVGDEIVKGIETGMKNAWTAFKSAIKTLIPTITPLFAGIVTAILPYFEDTFKKAGDLFSGEKWLQLGTDAIAGLLEGMKEKAGEVLEFIKSLAADSLTGLGQFWGSNSPATAFMPLGASVPQGIAVGINSAAGLATQAIQGMGRSLLTSASNTSRFIDDLNMGGIAAGNALSNWNDVRDILHLNIRGNMGSLAAGMGGGDITRMIGEQAGAWNVPPQMLQDIAQAQGLVEHFTDSFAAFQKEIAIENLGNMMQLGTQLTGLGSTFADMLTQQMAGGEGAIKTMEAYRKLTGEIGSQETQMATLQQELEALNAATERDTAAIEKKQKAIEKLTGEMEKNQKAIVATSENYAALQAQAFDLFSGSQTEAQRVGSELATIALLEDFLRSGDSSFLIPSDAVSQAAGITGILYDQISGQAELNRLVAEQAEREALITEQKEAQQKLDFLKSQLDLLKLGQSLGGDIFSGITFGLNASVEDMLAAVNAVTMAMVDQIDHDLGIASPSKLLFDKFKNQIGGAMVGGLLAVKPMMEGAIQPILNPIMQGANAAGRVVNNYFNQTVNTRADSSSVIGDFRTMQLMAG